MLNSRTPFLFNQQHGVPVVSIGAGDVPLGKIAPFVPMWTRNREWPGDPYPDAFRLPRLPLPLLMKVARFNRRFGLPRSYVTLPQLPRLTLTGVTRDNTGAPLGNCIVQLFRTANDQIVEEVTSDGSGNFLFNIVGLGQQYYLVAYKVGSPDTAGTSVNTLVGT